MTAPLNTRREPPFKIAGAILALLTVAVVVFVYFEFRGTFLDREKLTMISARAGLSMAPGAKGTSTGVEFGRAGDVQTVTVGTQPRAKIILEVERKSLHLIPKNVDA